MAAFTHLFIQTRQIKIMAINTTYALIVMIFVLFILILFAGVFKDFLFEYASVLGFEPAGSKQSSLTGAPVVEVACTEAVSTDCSGCPVYKVYDYKVQLKNVGIKSKDMKPNPMTPVLFFKNRAAPSSSTQTVQPGPDDKDGLKIEDITFIISTATESPKDPSPYTNPAPETGPLNPEYYVLGLFDKNDECYKRYSSDWGAPSPSKDEFLSQCASNFITSIAFSGPAITCDTGLPKKFDCSLLKTEPALCQDSANCWYSSITVNARGETLTVTSCNKCPIVTTCDDPEIVQNINKCKCGRAAGLQCFWDNSVAKCATCIPGPTGTRCEDLSLRECNIDNICGLTCKWDKDSNKCIAR